MGLKIGIISIGLFVLWDVKLAAGVLFIHKAHIMSQTLLQVMDAFVNLLAMEMYDKRSTQTALCIPVMPVYFCVWPT